MYKFLILGLIIVFLLCKAAHMRINNKDAKHLWVSFFIICIPFAFEKALEVTKFRLPTGALGGIFKITIPLLLCFVTIPIIKWNKFKIPFKSTSWISVIYTLIFISLLNPYNHSINASLYYCLFFSSHILLFYIFLNILTPSQLARGFYDGLMVLCFLQLILAICFPVLGLKVVTTLFHDNAGEWATRLSSNRVGAVGVFNHPGNLSLFIIIASCFFLSCYFGQFKAKLSLYLLAINTIVIILTYSRTSYLTYIIILFALYYIQKNARKNILSISVLFKFILPACIALTWLIFFSPLSEQFLKTDAGDQMNNRMVHYLLAYNIFESSPIFGVGINAHLAYLSANASLAKTITFVDFFFLNPIHNIHLIILAETGIIGFLLWIYFLLKNLYNSKKQIAIGKNRIFSSTFIGAILTYSLYGMTGWAPFSAALLPLFLFIAFFSIKYSISK